MKIELHEIPNREVVSGYIDSAENGVTGNHGRLNICPAFQREFIYKHKQSIIKPTSLKWQAIQERVGKE